MNILLSGVSIVKAQALTIDFETGLFSTGYNNVLIPGDQWSRFYG
jgi:hypothetical protein